MQSSIPSIAKAPTHLLWQDKAYAIGRGCKLPVDLSKGPFAQGQTACSIYLRNNDLFLEQHDNQLLTINGDAPEQIHKLGSGDVVNLGSEQLKLITVLPDG